MFSDRRCEFGDEVDEGDSQRPHQHGYKDGKAQRCAFCGHLLVRCGFSLVGASLGAMHARIAHDIIPPLHCIGDFLKTGVLYDA